MVEKSKCIEIFNSMIRGTPVSVNEDLIPLVSDYLTEIKYEKSDKLINLIVQNPQLLEDAFPTVIDYYCRKYNIFKLSVINPNGLNVQKTILYYE